MIQLEQSVRRTLSGSNSYFNTSAKTIKIMITLSIKYKGSPFRGIPPIPFTHTDIPIKRRRNLFVPYAVLYKKRYEI